MLTVSSSVWRNYKRRTGSLTTRYSRVSPNCSTTTPNLWYRNTIETVDNLRKLKKSLRDYYMQPGELRHLDRLIVERHQAGNEPIRAFVTDLCTLMRRHGEYNTGKQLDMLYYNAKVEYRLYLKRKEITSINELVQLCQELDET